MHGSVYAIENKDLANVLQGGNRNSYKLFGSRALEKEINLLKKFTTKDVRYFLRYRIFQVFIEKSIKFFEKLKIKQLKKQYYSDLSDSTHTKTVQYASVRTKKLHNGKILRFPLTNFYLSEPVKVYEDSPTKKIVSSKKFSTNYMINKSATDLDLNY